MLFQDILSLARFCLTHTIQISDLSAKTGESFENSISYAENNQYLLRHSLAMYPPPLHVFTCALLSFAKYIKLCYLYWSEASESLGSILNSFISSISYISHWSRRHTVIFRMCCIIKVNGFACYIVNSLHTNSSKADMTCQHLSSRSKCYLTIVSQCFPNAS